MEVTLCIAAALGSFALFASAVWYLSQDGFPVEGRCPLLTICDLARLPWVLVVLAVSWLWWRRDRLGRWWWMPTFCDVCWWGGPLGRTVACDGMFWCPRCGKEV